MFADDCILYRRIRSNEDRELLQRDLNTLGDWVKKNRMSINTGKSKCITFTNKRLQSSYSYRLGDEFITTSDNCKYLGVMFDKNLNWEKHVNLIVAKAYRTLHLVMRNLKGSSRKVKEKAYLSIVSPTL